MHDRLALSTAGHCIAIARTIELSGPTSAIRAAFWFSPPTSSVTASAGAAAIAFRFPKYGCLHPW
jgi:hypothetical protein